MCDGISVGASFSSSLGTSSQAFMIPRQWRGTQSIDLYDFVYIDFNINTLSSLAFTGASASTKCLRSFDFKIENFNNGAIRFTHKVIPEYSQVTGIHRLTFKISHSMFLAQVKSLQRITFLMTAALPINQVAMNCKLYVNMQNYWLVSELSANSIPFTLSTNLL